MNFGEYEKVTVGVDCVILTSDLHHEQNQRMESKRALQVLLIKRNIDPYKDMWSIPGGLVESNKSLIDTINDKLLDKINSENLYKEQLYTYGDDIHRDPRGRVITVGYIALAPKSKLSEIETRNSGEVKWFWVYLDNSNNVNITDPDTGESIQDLAFDHKTILKDALIRLRNKVIYTDIAFEVMPEYFTVRELQDIYENILGKPVYSFRRMVSGKIEETDKITEGKAHRPAKLFKLRREV